MVAMAIDPSDQRGDPMSASAQQATIRQYAKQLWLTTIGGQFLQVAEQAIGQKQSHLSYPERCSGRKWKSARNAVARRIKEAQFPKVNTLDEFTSPMRHTSPCGTWLRVAT